MVDFWIDALLLKSLSVLVYCKQRYVSYSEEFANVRYRWPALQWVGNAHGCASNAHNTNTYQVTILVHKCSY